MKIALFGPGDWCIGDTYRTLASLLNAKHLNWSVPHRKEDLQGHDRILTQAGEGTHCLVGAYQVDRAKIFAVGHAASDIVQWLKCEDNNRLCQYAGFGVISDTLAAESLSMGVTRVPVILRQGIDCSLYASSLPESLKTVGYAAVWERRNEYGVEIKRGKLVQEIANKVGLSFKSATCPAKPGETYYQTETTPHEKMPDFYRSVDVVIVSSLQEGGGMPMLEGAAAGRLTIGTPVGDIPRLAYEGFGLLAPLNEEAFVKFAVETLEFYKLHTLEFRSKCESIRQASRKRDWSNVIQDWIEFLKPAPST
jgi:glycosyltransferase involved in cell wall biosynthesis